MAVWSITCGSCGKHVSADVVGGWPTGTPSQQMTAAGRLTLWLQCPNCHEGSVKVRGDGISAAPVYPVAPTGRSVDGLPADLEQAWQEARLAHSVAAYSASEMMCRKILMHLAVNVANSKPGQSFVENVNDLEVDRRRLACLSAPRGACPPSDASCSRDGTCPRARARPARLGFRAARNLGRLRRRAGVGETGVTRVSAWLTAS